MAVATLLAAPLLVLLVSGAVAQQCNQTGSGYVQIAESWSEFLSGRACDEAKMPMLKCFHKVGIQVGTSEPCAVAGIGALPYDGNLDFDKTVSLADCPTFTGEQDYLPSA